MTGTTDVAVIGAGPGGYVAALHAAKLGKRVTLIEDSSRLGGICLNHGCIPSKALIHAASLFYDAKNAERMGISADVKIDLAKTQEWKESILDLLDRGIRLLLRQRKVKVIQGKAAFTGPTTVRVNEEDIAFTNAIIATGSLPQELPFLKFDHKKVLTSRDVLGLDKVPASLIVVGGSFVGLELGTVFAKLGSKVTIIELRKRLMVDIDHDVVVQVQRSLDKLGVEVFLNAKAEGLSTEGKLKFSAGGENKEIASEKILVAVGRKPNTAGLGLENTKATVDEDGFIIIDEQCRTVDKTIFAIGDVTGAPMLAHRASAQGKVAAEAIAGRDASMKGRAIPAAIYTDPEIGTVGLSEEEAKKRGIAVKTITFPFRALGKAHAVAKTDGFVKFVADSKGKILGVHIAGHSASEMIGEACLALKMGATLKDFAQTIHPHPSFVEGLMEAAWAALDEGSE